MLSNINCFPETTHNYGMFIMSIFRKLAEAEKFTLAGNSLWRRDMECLLWVKIWSIFSFHYWDVVSCNIGPWRRLHSLFCNRVIYIQHAVVNLGTETGFCGKSQHWSWPQWKNEGSITMMWHQPHGISNHQILDCLFNSLFRLISRNVNFDQWISPWK